MGFSVYGRIGGQNDDATSNYGRNSYYPTVIASRNYLSAGMSRPKVYTANTSNSSQPYNPKSATTIQKKENKKLKNILILAGSVTAAYLLRRPIESGLKAVRSGISRVVGPAAQKVSKVTIGEACGKIASPFIKVASWFKKKAPPTP